jgi:molybdopterin converting factor small subunit
MSVNVEMSSIFGRYTNNQLKIKVEGGTIRECLSDLVKQFPDLKRMLLDKAGNLLHGYDIYINGEGAYPLDMDRQLKDGDKMNVVYVIHGG